MEILQLKKLVDENFSIRKIAKEMNTSSSTVRYWLKKYNLKTNGTTEERTHWSKETIVDAIKNSSSKSDILRNIGLKINSGNFQTLEKYCKLYEIKLDHIKFNFKLNSTKNGFQKKVTNKEIFIKNSKRNNNNLIKKRILEGNLLKNECEICKISNTWMNKPIVLQIDHKNGNRFDNRLENLRFLCPNCHSQTETFCSKKR